MENSFNTSFIPKQSLQAGGETQYAKRRKIYGPGFFIMTVVFALSVGVSAALFFYTSSIERSIERKIQQIEQTRKSLRPDVVAEIAKMDARLSAAKRLLAEHYQVTNAFALLEDLTYLNVQYLSLDYVRPAPQNSAPTQADAPRSGAQVPMVTIVGRARDLDMLALQVDLYRSSEYLNNVSLESVDRDIEDSPETGFEILMQVDPRLLTTTNTAVDVESAPVVEEAPQAVVEEATEGVDGQDASTNNDGQQPTT